MSAAPVLERSRPPGPPRAPARLPEAPHRFARAVVEWAAASYGEGLVLSTSFGVQSAALLHLATRVVPEIPVLWVDTGYLPAETYRFAERLTRRLGLNLHVVQSPLSPARMEALHGRLWEREEPEALDLYHRIRKVEPMQRALRELSATAWMSGIRTEQTAHRARLPVVGAQAGRAKISPLLHWSARDVHRYLRAFDLPYHPWFDRGYARVGDWHSSRPVGGEDASERDSRFGGRREECGLHLPPEADESFDSSGL